MTEVKNIPASVRQRLLNKAKEQNADFQRVLVRYAVERFLYRLSRHVTANRFVLKGAMLFITWPETMFRPTGDLDLLGSGPSEPAIVKQLVIEILQIADLTDGLVFHAETVDVEPIREEDEYQGVRVSCEAHLGTAIIPLKIDIGFGDRVYPPPRSIHFPCLLDGMPAAEVLAYPPETVIAEKFEAMVRYGEATSRLKDFYDIWAIAKTFRLDKASVAQAMRGTLERRGTEIPREIPFALTPAFSGMPAKLRIWDGFVQRSSLILAPPPLSEVCAALRQFLGPVLIALDVPNAATGNWNPDIGWTDQ